MVGIVQHNGHVHIYIYLFILDVTLFLHLPVFSLLTRYGEVNSVKNKTINIWLNDGVY